MGSRDEPVPRPRGSGAGRARAMRPSPRGAPGLLTFSFSTKPTKAVRSISTGCPCRSYRARTKWKKLDFLRLEGGCFSK